MNNYKTLRLNDTGDEVKIIQQLLKIAGFYPASITGSFDTTTENAVKEFQRENNLRITGVVNKETWDKLIKQTENTNQQFENIFLPLNSNTNIKEMQQKLKETLYYDGEITGEYDEATINAIKRFQLNNDILANGILNTKTINTIDETYSSLIDCTLIDNEEKDLETYIVQKGDTLYSIAKEFNTTVDYLKKINNLLSNTLIIGTKILVPKKNNSNNTTTYYIVQKGDTLYSISRAYNVSVEELKKANNLTSNTLSIGQKLIIPNNEEDYETYIVQKGDTLYSISKKFNVSVNEIMNLNNLSNSILTPGQTLVIPKKENNDNQTIYQNYIVQKGDTLFSISKKFNVDIDTIKKINNLTSNTLSIGQELKIPSI